MPQLLLESEVAPVEGASSSPRDGMQPPPAAAQPGAAVEEVPLAGEAQEAKSAPQPVLPSAEEIARRCLTCLPYRS
eukprot:11806105-Alexandrium_andersonii.AAC.1